MLFIAWSDPFFCGYVTSKRVNYVHDYTFQLYYVYLNLGMQKDINFLLNKSQQIVVV